MGLLYGKNDFTRTLEIATRCGQDADCNPSTAGGILGTILGYDHIPAYWKLGLKEAENIPFKYTTMSLDDVYATGFKHALQNIERNGGKINGDNISIALQKAVTVKMEKSFGGIYPVKKIPVQLSDNKDALHFEFEGTGFVLKGETARWASTDAYVFNTALYVDDKLIESPELPVNYTTRRYEICWKYDLPKGKHTVQLKILNPSKDFNFNASEAIIYADKPVNGLLANDVKGK
jgi:hypothetical protein